LSIPTPLVVPLPVVTLKIEKVASFSTDTVSPPFTD